MTRVGVDLIEIERVRRSLERYAGFRDRCFTPVEQAYCDSRKNPAESYAGRFAGSGGSSEAPDHGNFYCLLCLGGHAKHQEHGA